MPLISPITRYTGNPRAYPAGIAPGFDPTHLAAKGVVTRFSGIARDGSFVSLLNGEAGVIGGTPTFAIDGYIGPSAKFVASTDLWKFPNQNTTATTTFTIAFIFRYASITTNQGLFGASATNNVAFYFFNGAGPMTIKLAATSTTVPFSNTNFIAAGIPHFIVLSVSGTTANCLAVRLTDNVSDQAVGFTVSGTPGVSDGNYLIGNTAGAAGAAGNIACAMYSTAYLSIPEMRQWAANPWSFWYPQLPSAWMNWLVARQIAAASGGSIQARLFAPKLGQGGALLGGPRNLLNPRLAYPPAVQPIVVSTAPSSSTLPMMGVG